jgi:hypothetical protein
MEHLGKEAPFCNPDGKIKNKCAATATLARQIDKQTDTTFALIYRIFIFNCR